MSIPILNAAPLINGNDQELAEFRTKMVESLAESGFVRLIHHPVETPLVRETFDQIKKFFQLPYEDKKPVINDRTHSQQRGWCLPGEEKTWYLESNDGTIAAPKFSDAKV